MEYPEKIPITQATQQFPMGDITSEHSHQKADIWLHDIAEQDRRHFIGRIRVSGMMPSDYSEKSRKTHRAALDLCREWNQQMGENLLFASSGYLIANTFSNETRFLPSISDDFSDELFQMQLEKSDQAQQFAQYAWRCMAYSHPRVHEKLSHLQSLSEDMLCIQSDQEREYLQAGIVLPYILSVASRLIGYSSGIHGFSGMVTGEKEELMDAIKNNKFKKLFINDVALAPDVIITDEEK